MFIVTRCYTKQIPIDSKGKNHKIRVYNITDLKMSKWKLLTF